MHIYELWLAWRFLFSRHSERLISVVSFFSFFGILLGVATLITVMSVMNGFRSELLKTVWGMNGHITLIRPHGVVLSESVKKSFVSVPFVKNVFPFIEEQALISSQGKGAAVVVKAEDLKDLMVHETFRKLSKDAQDLVEGGTGIIVGSSLAEHMDWAVGDTVTLMRPTLSYGVYGLLPKMKQYTVAGIFTSGMYVFDTSYVYMSLSQAKKFFETDDRVAGIELFLTSLNHLDKVEQSLQKKILQYNFEIVDWRKANQSVLSAVETERRVMALILSLLIIIASFNVISGQTLLLQDKKFSLAVLRSLGMSRFALLRIFLFSGCIPSIVGSFFGLGIGVLLVKNIQFVQKILEYFFNSKDLSQDLYYLVSLPAQLDGQDVLFVMVGSLLLSFLSSFYPAFKASQTEIIDLIKSHG